MEYLIAEADVEHYRRTGHERLWCPCCAEEGRPAVHLAVANAEYCCPQCGSSGTADIEGVRMIIPEQDQAARRLRDLADQERT